MDILIKLYFSWFKMGMFTFGGGYAMLPMIQKEVIDKYQWATEKEVMDYYAIGQCTPGIIAVNTATFIGYKLKGIIGAIVATLGVITPSIIIIFIIASTLNNFQEYAIVQNALAGIRIGVCFLMLNSIYKLLKSNVKDLYSFIFFLITLLIMLFTNISIVMVVIIAAIVGIVVFNLKGVKND